MLPSSNSSAKKTSRKWDQSILSSVCRWRACLCEVDTSEDGTIIEGVDSGKSINSNPNARYLCSYHAKVCRYLDNAYLKDVKARGSETDEWVQDVLDGLCAFYEQLDAAGPWQGARRFLAEDGLDQMTTAYQNLSYKFLTSAPPQAHFQRMPCNPPQLRNSV